MSERLPLPTRKDATRNRERILQAAQTLFIERGFDVPLEDVARAAEVSRTTVYRNFECREELAATVYEGNVALIEARAATLAGQPNGIVLLFDYTLDLMLQSRTIVPVLSRADVAWFEALADRTRRAFTPLVEEGQRSGIVRPGVEIVDFLLAFQMAETALVSNEHTTREQLFTRARRLVHQALFVAQEGHSQPGAPRDRFI